MKVRTFDPLPEGHPVVGERCAICYERIDAGDVTALVPVRPATPDNHLMASHGRAHIAVARPVHAECAQDD